MTEPITTTITAIKNNMDNNNDQIGYVVETQNGKDYYEVNLFYQSYNQDTKEWQADETAVTSMLNNINTDFGQSLSELSEVEPFLQGLIGSEKDVYLIGTHTYFHDVQRAEKWLPENEGDTVELTFESFFISDEFNSYSLYAKDKVGTLRRISWNYSKTANGAWDGEVIGVDIAKKTTADAEILRIFGKTPVELSTLNADSGIKFTGKIRVTPSGIVYFAKNTAVLISQGTSANTTPDESDIPF
jgi:hypothetical protein